MMELAKVAYQKALTSQRTPKSCSYPTTHDFGVRQPVAAFSAVAAIEMIVRAHTVPGIGH